MKINTAYILLEDLAQHGLEVMLVPSRRPEEAERGGMIRLVIDKNPLWYRKLCEAHQKNRTKQRWKRKPDTRIVRRDVIRLLERAANAQPVKSYIIDWLDKCLHLPD